MSRSYALPSRSALRAPIKGLLTAGPLLPGLLMAGSLTLSLAGCGLNQRPVAENREVQSDCNAESDRIFAARNRDQISERNSTDTPYSANSLPYNPTAGLSDQYERDRLVDDCLRHGTAATAKP